MQTTLFKVEQYVKLKNNPHAPTWQIVELQINLLICKAVNNCTGQTMCQSFDYSQLELVEQPNANYK